MEKLSRKILSLPVLSVNEGEQLGYIKSIVVDPAIKEIIAFVIDQKGWFKEDKIIPFNRVTSIGENAVVIDKSGTAEKPANFPQILKLLKSPAQLINSKVVSTTGKALGQVEEFWFDSSGKITKLEISGRGTEGIWKGKAALPCEEVVTMGKDVVIVADGAEKRLIPSAKHLRTTMHELKSVTTKAWESTMQTSQKLGQAIAHSISKLAEEEDKITKPGQPEPPGPTEADPPLPSQEPVSPQEEQKEESPNPPPPESPAAEETKESRENKE
ncbi:PRC-barrel domain-containing protein [Candidatus Formimonas warabiya]|uniref:PRC-barrel domain-containing protein n=1 Tax=Formimonas warabiya TaxID=1761012 RepID=A0A3G1KXP9_FORW1|nr:PRC-barrel domain-containing protein [Candidatus Formimonas warabiya]ATW26985.1 hypothetical protein DCMF_21445 [Candidatus Formimonas warabiya]